MVGQQNLVSLSIDERALTLRVCAPQHKDNRVIAISYLMNQRVGQHLPTPSRMAGRKPFFHRQACVE